MGRRKLSLLSQRHNALLLKKVEQAQARLRLNIEALTARDGLKENTLVGRYVEAMATEEEKLAASVALEADLLMRHKAAASIAATRSGWSDSGSLGRRGPSS